MVRKRVLACAVILALVLGVLAATPSFSGDPTARQTRPIPLGVSGGNVRDRTPMYCCSGTLGALVKRADTNFILSNNHVLAKTNKGRKKQKINQPGNVDVGCQKIREDYVAKLWEWVRIKFDGSNNRVDAAIAKIKRGKVKTNGRMLDIGVPGKTPVNAMLGMHVKKMGRTTGLTFGVVSAVDVIVDVRYSKKCGSAETREARFVGQIQFKPGAFSAPGDSGSLIVQNVANCPRPVALLFAGDATYTYGSPIQAVLNKLNVNMVGCTAAQEAVAADPYAADVVAARAAKAEIEDTLLALPDVVGVGIGLGGANNDEVVIKVFLAGDNAETIAAIPAAAGGYPIVTVVTGAVYAF